MSARGKSTVVGRWVVGIAVVLTVMIAAGAFWLSFAALAHLAFMSGVPGAQAWVWPVIVDGMIVAGTVSIVAMSDHEPRARRYPWAVLIGGAVLSVSANVVHAVVATGADRQVPVVVAALVASVAPVALLVMTHLTVLLTRKAAPARPSRRRRAVPPPAPVTSDQPLEVPGPVEPDQASAPAAGEGADAVGRRLQLVEGRAGGGEGEELAAWVRTQVAAGESVSGPAAVRAGVATSESTARRRLRELREQSPELFDVDAVVSREA